MVEQLNQKALEIHTNPHILLDEMSLEEFADWIKINDTQFCDSVILENLMNILIDYEMYEYCEVVKKRINNE